MGETEQLGKLRAPCVILPSLVWGILPLLLLLLFVPHVAMLWAEAALAGKGEALWDGRGRLLDPCPCLLSDLVWEPVGLGSHPRSPAHHLCDFGQVT